MSMLDVGVVLAVRNGEAFLREALDSIAAQTLQPTDVVAVDDGSTDGSADLLRAFGIRTLHTDHVGQALARDRGIADVRGDVIAFLDQDDRWLPNKLARQVARLRSEPTLDFVGALSTVFLDPGADRPPWWKPLWDKGIPEPSLLPSATLYRRRAFDRVGGFAAAPVSVSEDMAWTARAQDLGLRRAIVDEVLVQRRIHGHNTSGDQNLRVREHLAIVRHSLARKRATGG
jgi:glycosyltransferase involved in cell wall biosynthesis